MGMRTVAGLIVIATMVLVAMFAGCIENTTKVSDFLDNPDKYNGKKVTIEGYAEEMSSYAFVIRDETDAIPVRYEGDLPAVGNKVRVTGIVEVVRKKPYPPIGRVQVIYRKGDSFVRYIYISGESWEHICGSTVNMNMLNELHNVRIKIER